MPQLRSVFVTKRRIAALVATVSFAATAGGALAYWHRDGAGSGSATAGTAQAVTVVAFVGGDTPNSSLQPGGTADVILRLSNPNSYAV
ncbi:MAG TPA: hypothetical protein VFO23_07880, partial [Steroidobacteraceae bacterium]|nr:hypothetical protein [Steroidobacteraceae bacterium]